MISNRMRNIHSYDSSCLLAWLWRNDELSEYQQESQLSPHQSEHPPNTHAKMSKMYG